MNLYFPRSTEQPQASSEQEKFPGKILVITSCTKNKNNPFGLSPQNQLGPDDLWDDKDDDRVARDFGNLEAYRVPAGVLYSGNQHQQVMQGVKALRRAFGDDLIDVKIISAGFGLIDEEQAIPPYNVTFADIPSSKVFPLASRLGIPQTVNALMKENYNCAFFLLGESYLPSLGLPFKNTPSFPCLFLASSSSRKGFPASFPY